MLLWSEMKCLKNVHVKELLTTTFCTIGLCFFYNCNSDLILFEMWHFNYLQLLSPYFTKSYFQMNREVLVIIIGSRYIRWLRATLWLVSVCVGMYDQIWAVPLQVVTTGWTHHLHTPEITSNENGKTGEFGICMVFTHPSCQGCLWRSTWG